MFKIAYGAGHYLYEAGKRLPAQLDPKQTREWVLNDRVARYFAQAAAQYEGVELLRVDDPTGENWITLAGRCKAANDWGADFCLAIHHNAGANLTKAGGVVAYILNETSPAKPYQEAIYNAVITAGGLRGNRSEPLATANFQVLWQTVAPAVLMEYGFMDSLVDAPVILTEEYSKLVAYATMEGIAKLKGLKKKAARQEPEKITLELDVLSEGSAGPQVYAVQTMLNGFIDAGVVVDSDYGSQTESAVKEYQQKRSLPVTGKVDLATWTQLMKK